MGPWIETSGVMLTALAGVAAGTFCARGGKVHWGWGYFFPLLMVAILLGATYIGTFYYNPVLVFISGSRLRFVILCLAVTIGSTTLLWRLRRRFERLIMLAVMIAVVMWSSVLPFAYPLFINDDLGRIENVFDNDNICIQTTTYTCGPAAAVTALDRLGLSAREGQIAILAHTSPIVGTLPWCLYRALDENYSRQGLQCEFRYFNSVDQLRDAGITLAVVKDAFLIDHCVAVLNVTDRMVTVADPVTGKMVMSHKQFEECWRFYGIVLSRSPS
jgi:hypothetical protein